MTPLEKIAELKALLSECKEALMNRDPQTREKECYDSGHVPCQCTLCKINEGLKDCIIKEPVIGIIAGRISQMILESQIAGDNAINKGYDPLKIWCEVMKCNLEMLAIEMRMGNIMTVEEMESIKDM